MKNPVTLQAESQLHAQHDDQHRTKIEWLKSAQLELAYRRAPVGFALFDPREFRLLSFNDHWSEIVNLFPEQLLNKTIDEIAPGVERHWLVNYTPIFDDHGAVEAISTVSLEITADKQLAATGIQANLVQTEAKYRGEYQKALRPELILLDLNLPRMDGRKVLALIKQSSDLKTIPIIILTTSAAEADIKRSYELQASCYLTTPSHLEEFENIIASPSDFWLSKVWYLGGGNASEG